MAKFIQICVATVDEGESLYALDDEGVVWGYFSDKDVWHPIPMRQDPTVRSPWDMVLVPDEDNNGGPSNGGTHQGT